MSDNSDPEDREEIRIFVREDKKPVQFYLHASLTDQQQRELEKRIETHGGEICKNEEDADTILVNYEQYGPVFKRYAHSQTIYVERPDFVKRCLNRKMYDHDKVLKPSLGGLPPGRDRREYTNYDDDLLAEYIARRIPDHESGGRLGNGIYKELCDPIFEQWYPWAKNHTWQSWRNRFKTNQELFIVKIDEYLRKNPPRPDGKGEYAHDRRSSGLGKRNRALGHRHLNIRRAQSIDDRSEEESTFSEVEANDRDGVDGRGAQGDSGRIPKRARTSVTDVPSSVARAQRGHVRSSTGIPRGGRSPAPQENRDDLYRFSDDPGLDDFDPGVVLPSTREQEPSNTQATLVPTQPKRPAGTSSAKAPLTSTPLAEPRMAARNRERSAAAKSGATGRTVFVPSPPKDTQATVVATQSGALQPSEPQKVARDASKMVSNNIPPTQITGAGPVLVSTSSAEVQEQKVRRAADHANRASTTVVGRQRQGGGGDAPYRNTRARSQSVEPPAVPPPTAPAFRRNKRRAPMQALKEQEEEDAGHQSMIDTADEVPDEQQSIKLVEKILDEEEEEEDASGSDADLDLLIKQKAKQIRELSGSNNPPQSSSSFNQDEIPSLQIRHKVTPRRQGSSESNFPIKSTRAKEVRLQQELNERVEPYSPIPGSRAERAKEAQRRAQMGRHERLRRKGQQSVTR